MKHSLLLLSLLSLYKTLGSDLPSGGVPSEEAPPPTTTTTTATTTETETPEVQAPTHTPSLFTVLTHGLEPTPAPTTPQVTAADLERIEKLKDAHEKERIERLNTILKDYVPAVEKGQIAHKPVDPYQVAEGLRKQRRLISAEGGLSGIGAEMELGEVLSGVVSGMRKQGRSSKQSDLYVKIADADTSETKPEVPPT